MAARKKKTTQKVTVNELQSYIKGAIEFNEDDWHPDKRQWDKIVEMIMNIKQDVVEKVVEKQASTVRTQQNPKSLAASSMDGGQVSGNPQISEYRGPRQPVKATNAQSLEVQKIGDGGVDENGKPSSGISIKTPTDHSGEPYESGFT